MRDFCPLPAFEIDKRSSGGSLLALIALKKLPDLLFSVAASLVNVCLLNRRWLGHAASLNGGEMCRKIFARLRNARRKFEYGLLHAVERLGLSGAPQFARLAHRAMLSGTEEVRYWWLSAGRARYAGRERGHRGWSAR